MRAEAEAAERGQGAGDSRGFWEEGRQEVEARIGG